MKIGTLVTPALSNVHTNFGFLCLSAYELEARTKQTDRRTDGQTDGQDPYWAG